MARITSGDLVEGDRIAPANELGEQYGISVNSVRSGVKLLESRGLLVRRQGSGTYVQSVVQPETPAQTPRQVAVARTHVAVLWHTTLHTYHPYFSELRRGVEETLQLQGWSTWTPDFAPSHAPSDIVWNDVSSQQLMSQFERHPELAGAVVGSSIAGLLTGDLAPPFPVVAEAENPHVPYAAYDWADESDFALRSLLRQGCREIAVLKLRHDGDMDAMFRRACGAEGIARDQVAIRELPAPRAGRVLSHWISESYAITGRVLKAGELSFDGFLIGDEFCAQGALDAMQEHDPQLARRVPIAILTSGKGQIHSNIPFTAVVSDGYTHGKAVADLLSDHITRPLTAPRMVTLRGSLRTSSPRLSTRNH